MDSLKLMEASLILLLTARVLYGFLAVSAAFAASFDFLVFKEASRVWCQFKMVIHLVKCADLLIVFRWSGNICIWSEIIIHIYN